MVALVRNGTRALPVLRPPSEAKFPVTVFQTVIIILIHKWKYWQAGGKLASRPRVPPRFRKATMKPPACIRELLITYFFLASCHEDRATRKNVLCHRVRIWKAHLLKCCPPSFRREELQLKRDVGRRVLRPCRRPLTRILKDLFDKHQITVCECRKLRKLFQEPWLGWVMSLCPLPRVIRRSFVPAL
jgi:hypothetical protein